MAFAKFEENRLRIGGEIAENNAILINLTASIVTRPRGSLQSVSPDPGSRFFSICSITVYNFLKKFFEVGIVHAIANFKWKENTSSLKN